MYSTSYATSIETYVGYGPYKLESFQADKNFKFTRNDSWVGYKNGLNEGKYQIDSVSYEVVSNNDTVLTMFRKGEIDSYSLLGTEKKIFDSSSRVVNSPTGHVTKLTLNSVYDFLKALQDKESDGSNHTILSNINFRKALSLGFDRKTFCQVKTEAWIPFNVPISAVSLADPDNKTIYRDTKEGKAVVERHFGLDEGKPNYISFDLMEARKLIDKAVEEENASNREGSYKKGQKVHLIWECPTEGWKDRIFWIIENYKKLMQGTLLEDKFEIEIKSTSSNDFVKHMRNGICDMAISTWTGGNVDPFTFIGVYTDSKRAFEPYPVYRDYLEIDLDTGEYSSKRGDLVGIRKNAVGMKIDSEESGQEKGHWYYELTSGRYNAIRSDIKTRLNILSALESHIVGQFNFITFAMRQSSSINSYRLKEGVDNYIPLLGYGGIREMRLLKNNSEWKKWVNANTDSAGYIDYNK